MNLVPLTGADSAGLFDLWSDFETVKFTNWVHTPDRAAFVARLERLRAYYARDPLHLGPMVIRSNDQRFLGLVGADHTSAAEVSGDYELWYLLRRSEWGRGYGAQAVAAFLAMAAEARPMQRMVATAVSANRASWRILERHGFRRESTQPGGFARHGLQLDLFRYVREFPGQRDRAVSPKR